MARSTGWPLAMAAKLVLDGKDFSLSVKFLSPKMLGLISVHDVCLCVCVCVCVCVCNCVCVCVCVCVSVCVSVCVCVLAAA